MEFKNDFILDMVNSFGHGLAKTLFKVKDEGEPIEIGNLSDKDIITIILKKLIVEGNFSEAEDTLFEFAENIEEMTKEEILQIGQWFYDELDSLKDEALHQGNFSRDEIQQGLRDFIKKVNDK